MNPSRTRFAKPFIGLFLAAALAFPIGCGRDGRKAGEGPLRTVDDLHGRKIGVLLGSMGDFYATKAFPDAEIVRLDSQADRTNALLERQVDAILCDVATVRLIIRLNPGMVILGNQLFERELGIAFRKDDPTLREQFNAFVADTRKSGLYEEIRRRWIDSPETAVMPGLPPPGGGKPIVLGTSDMGLPFSTLQDGRHVGFDIEIAERFARHLDRGLEIRSLPFASLLPALASGKVDMIASSLAITEERKQQADFSDPYFTSGLVAVALAENVAGVGPRRTAGRHSFLKTVADAFYNNLILEKRYLLILEGLETTVLISVFAALLGTFLGAAICLLRMHRSPLLSHPARFFICILRGTPLLVLLMIMFYLVFASVDIDPVLASVVTFALNFAAYVSEMFRMAVKSVDKGQMEAGIALGFSRFGAFRHIVLPQATRHVLPVYRGEVISMIKMTSIVGYIAVTDLTKASDIIRSRTFDAFFPLIMVAVLYFFLTWLLTLGLVVLEKRLDPRSGRGREVAP